MQPADRDARRWIRRALAEHARNLPDQAPPDLDGPAVARAADWVAGWLAGDQPTPLPADLQPLVTPDGADPDGIDPTQWRHQP